MDAVGAAFDAVPRAGFLPEAARWRAGFDGPITIGRGQTNSQPRTVADMLRLLDVHPGQRVLDVGSGVELEPELATWGERNLRNTAYSWASIRCAERGVLGLPEGAPYDRILVSAEARELPGTLVAQLAADGRMVLPVRGTMTLVVCSGGRTTTSRHGSYRFVPLR